MKNQHILFIALCYLMTMTQQENNKLYNSHRKGFVSLDQNEFTVFDRSDNFPKLNKDNRKYNLYYGTIHRHRVKRNLLRRFITKFKETMSLESEEGNVYRSGGIWSYPQKYGTIPNAAFSAGLDTFGQPVFIGRGAIPGDKSVVPGRLQENEVCVEVAWKGWGRCLGNYEVLIGNTYTWKPGHRDWFPYVYVIAGTQETLEDGQSRLFICRYYIRDENLTDQLVVGKVTRDGRCSVGYNGEESIYHGVYEILTVI